MNVHRRHEGCAFQAFYESFWTAIENLKEQASDERTRDAFLSALPEDFRLHTPLQVLYSKGEAFRAAPSHPVEVTLEDVAWMKRLCDLFFLQWAKSQHEKRASAT